MAVTRFIWPSHYDNCLRKAEYREMRQKIVGELYSLGLSNSEIAEFLFLTPKTVARDLRLLPEVCRSLYRRNFDPIKEPSRFQLGLVQAYSRYMEDLIGAKRTNFPVLILLDVVSRKLKFIEESLIIKNAPRRER